MIKNRSEVLTPSDQVNLTVQFRDPYGRPFNCDSFPTISIVQPNNLMFLAPTSVGVHQIGVGNYSYIFTVPYAGSLGLWADIWVGYINGFRIEANFNFAVLATEIPQPDISAEGKRIHHLGDDPGFHYSQCAIININKLLKALKARLNSSGKGKSTDAYGNTTDVSTDIFSVGTLVTFLATALTEFNEVPYFTFFTFDEDAFVDQFFEVLVSLATIYALASQALIERGREYSISDQGIQFNPPSMSEMLQTQYSGMLTQYYDKLKYIKNSLRPAPRGLGVMGIGSGVNPAIRRLRHLRERQII